MLPFLIKAGDLPFKKLDYLFIPQIQKAVREKLPVMKAYCVKDGVMKEFELALGDMTDEEREIILRGCLINYNKV